MFITHITFPIGVDDKSYFYLTAMTYFKHKLEYFDVTIDHFSIISNFNK